METGFHHVPIMVTEVLTLLEPSRGGVFVDGTLGGGGHAEAVLSALPETGKLFGIDRDDDALKAASARLSRFGDRFTAIKGNFFDMKELLAARGVDKVDGILLDLGVSSHQLDVRERGFSYKAEAPLDMRMDQSAPLTARTVVNEWSEAELRRIFWEYGEEKFSGKIAARIVERRKLDRIFAADALILGSPIYLGDVTSQVHGLMERLRFCTLSYDDYSNYFTGRVNVGLILTMNASKAYYRLAYRKKAEELAGSFRALNGSVEILPCCDTLQVADYSRYDMASFSDSTGRCRQHGDDG